MIDETGFLKQGKASCGVGRDFQLPTSQMRSDCEAEGDVLEACETTPDDHVTGRWVVCAGQVAAERGNSKNVGGQGSVGGAG